MIESQIVERRIRQKSRASRTLLALAAGASILLPACTQATQSIKKPSCDLNSDPEFQGGVRIINPTPGSKVPHMLIVTMEAYDLAKIARAKVFVLDEGSTKFHPQEGVGLPDDPQHPERLEQLVHVGADRARLYVGIIGPCSEQYLDWYQQLGARGLRKPSWPGLDLFQVQDWDVRLLPPPVEVTTK